MANIIDSGVKVGQGVGFGVSQDKLAILDTLLKATQGGVNNVATLNPGVGGLPKLALDAAQTVLKKYYTGKAEEALKTPGGEDVLNQLITSAEAAEPTGEASTSTSQEPTPQENNINQALTGNAQSNPMAQLGNFLFNQGGVDQMGVAQAPSLLGGLIQNRNPQDMLARQQAANARPEMLLGLEGAKASFKQSGEEYKQNRLDQREELKASLKQGGGTGLETFQTDMTNLVNAWDATPIKAGTLGLGGLAGQGLAALNLGSEQVANFESQANAFLYSAASFIAKQQGRDVTEKDIEKMKKVAGFKLTDSEEKFNGKLQAVINLVNARAGKGPRMPNARTFRKQAKSTPKQGQGTTQGRFQIEVIDG